MFVVDASVWVSRFVVSDIHHGFSYQWLNRSLSAGEEIIGPALLLAELAGAVARVTGDTNLALGVISSLQQLPNSRLVPVDFELARISANLAAELRLRGADSFYVALAQRLSIPLITWDNEQIQRGSSVATAITPQEALNP